MKLAKQFTKNFLVIIAIFLAISIIASFLVKNTDTKEVDLSVVAKQITSSEVKKIIVDYNSLEIELLNGVKETSKKEPGIGLVQTLKDYGIAPEALQKIDLQINDNSYRDMILGNIFSVVLPLLGILFIFSFFVKKAGAGASQAMNFGRANIHLFANYKDQITFKDVAGLKEAKQELEEVVDFLKHPSKFLDLGAKIPRGVLLMGPPGSGKTLLARAVAGEAGVPFFHISASEFVEMFVGVGAARTRDAFQTAKKAAPSILFIDEIDAVGRERGAGLGGGHDEREQTLNQILVEMDGFDRDTNVIVLAATNRPDVLDQALLRPGRFDRRVTLDLPDIKEREEILTLHSKNKPLDKEVNLRKIAIRTPGFSGADLANALNEAAILTARRNKKIISQQEIYDAIEKVILGPERKSKIVSERERNITAFHEAGHALVSAGLKDADPVHKISIVSRGRAGGYTLKLPSEDQRLKTRNQFLADLSTLLAGFISEREMFSDTSTGASNDLKVASEIARKAITRYGMSDKLGPITFGDNEELVFLGRDIASDKNYSEKTASLIDDEVKNMIDKAQRTTEKIIRTYKPALKAIAEELIKKETLEQEEFYSLLKPFNLKQVRV